MALPRRTVNAGPHTSSAPRRVVVTVNGTSRLTYVTPAATARPSAQEVFSLLPKRLVTSSKRQVVRMSLSVIVGFVACWLPYFAVSIVRIFSDYRVRLAGLLSATELLALAHSALNPLIYGLFSARTLRRSCGQRCRRRRRRLRDDSRTSRWDMLLHPCCCCCCCCGGQTVVDVSPDIAAGAVPPPLMLAPDTGASAQPQPPPIELRDMTHFGFTAAATRRRHGRGRCAVDGRPTSAVDAASTTSTSTTDDACCRKSASAEFQCRLQAAAATQRSRRRRAHLPPSDRRLVVSAAVIADLRDVPASDPNVRTVVVPQSTSTNDHLR